VDRGKNLHGLKLDHDPTFHEQIHTKTIIEGHVIVFEGDGFLPLDPQAAPLKRLGQYGLIDRFQEAWAQILVDLQGGINDGTGDVVQRGRFTRRRGGAEKS